VSYFCQLALIIFLSFSLNAQAFSGSNKKTLKLKNSSSQNLNIKKCSKDFKDFGTDFKSFIKTYSSFSCFPLLTTKTLMKNHSDKNWAIKSLSKENYKKILSPEETLELKKLLHPYIKNKNLTEKSLLDQIDLKSKLGLDISNEKFALQKKFPSHNPENLKNPNLKVVKDLTRRGLNTQALIALKRLKKKYPNGDKVNQRLISTQKNIKRDSEFLRYSQEYTDIVYNRYRKNRNKWKRRDYLKHGLLNIRRIWTYRSTDEALKRLSTLVKHHCKVDSECAEHYWIMGRIFEEKENFTQARAWLLKAINSTSIKSSEYINRLWNLVWLESKYISNEQALNSSKLFSQKLPEEEVSSKLYFWMSRWALNDSEKSKYIKLIKKHHPLSFYLWSPLALGQGFKLSKKTSIKIDSSNRLEKELKLLTESNYPNLTRAFIRSAEKQKDFKKTKPWKRLKALNGMYSDLLLDIEAKTVSPESHLVYLFSTKYRSIIEKKAIENNIPKELIWSIIRQESNFNPFARSWADAFGLMQVLEKRALAYLKSEQNLTKSSLSPIEMFDPSFNISIGAWLLKNNLRDFQGKLPLAIASYNANGGKVKQWEKRFYKGDFLPMIEEISYRETRKYVKLVLRNIEIYSQLSN